MKNRHRVVELLGYYVVQKYNIETAHWEMVDGGDFNKGDEKQRTKAKHKAIEYAKYLANDDPKVVYDSGE